jgi:CMP-N,N'-diacetyllegionaminic acid synthase
MTRPSARREILALIPARGGSKGIPRKNLLLLAGMPLVAYSIEQALASRCITRTIVSTDDAEIAEVSRTYGADVPFMRPSELAQDRSPDVDVFRHALEWLRDRENYRCDLVVHLRPTAPVRRVALVDEAIERMAGQPDADSLRSVSRPEQTPYKMWRIVEGRLEPLLPIVSRAEAHSLPRQELPEVYWQNGYVDVVRPHVVLDLGMMAGHRIVPFIVRDPVPELDYVDDIPRLEAALSALRRGEWPGVASTTATRYPV